MSCMHDWWFWDGNKKERLEKSGLSNHGNYELLNWWSKSLDHVWINLFIHVRGRDRSLC